jgi:hypothetical protein
VRPCVAADNCSPAQEKDGIPTAGNADPATGQCANGAPEFSPIKDIHVGVITSSLGSHGAGPADICPEVGDNDHAHLLGSIRPTYMPPLEPYDGNGFLKWDTTKPAKYPKPGESNGARFTEKFTNMVRSSGERGCGFEASLEAWYRFLIDPEPPGTITVGADSRAVVQDIDATVKAQREAFLRPDSLVAIVMLTDENDCSIQDTGYGWLIARNAPMFRSTSQCAVNPNDTCCQSCAEDSKTGCPAINTDAECAKGKTLVGEGLDEPNLRCWQQKRRFGFELLYPTTRYSDGLRNTIIRNRANQEVANPLFAASNGKTGRDKGLVFLAGIVGVPWQDIADQDSLTGPGLRYMTASELESAGRWATILGTSNAGTMDPPIPPADPLMVEQPDARTGTNPITNEALAPATSTNPQANKINGHEQANMGNRDLQYACIFPLAEPLVCDEAARMADKGCDCFDDDTVYNRPLCQPPGGGPAGTTQHFAKAYPGLRHLQVLKEFKDNSIVASICPKISDQASKTKPDYGYNPAVKAIIDRLKDALKGKCLPRPLVPADQEQDGLEVGQVPCKVIEAVLPPNGGACSCPAGAKRVDTTTVLRDAVLEKLKEGGTCGDKEGQSKCESFCTCELLQFTGSQPGGDLNRCQNDAGTPSTPGYCYVNAAPNEPNVGNPALVEGCSADSKRLLRFAAETPAAGAIAMVACLGASLGSTQ